MAEQPTRLDDLKKTMPDRDRRREEGYDSGQGLLDDEEDQGTREVQGEDFIDSESAGEDQQGAVYVDYDELGDEDAEVDDHYPRDGSGSSEDDRVTAGRKAGAEKLRRVLDADELSESERIEKV